MQRTPDNTILDRPFSVEGGAKYQRISYAYRLHTNTWMGSYEVSTTLPCIFSWQSLGTDPRTQEFPWKRAKGRQHRCLSTSR